MSITLTLTQKKSLIDYFINHPYTYQREKRLHRYDPTDCLGRYMWEELFEESFHEDIRHNYNQYHLFTDHDLQIWERQEEHEFLNFIY